MTKKVVIIDEKYAKNVELIRSSSKISTNKFSSKILPILSLKNQMINLSPTSSSIHENNTSIKQLLPNEAENNKLNLSKPEPKPKEYKIVTSFDELCELKARSRTPIDIQHMSNSNQLSINSSFNINKFKLGNTNSNSINPKNHKDRESHGNSYHYSNNEHNTNENESTINFSKLLNATKYKSERNSTNILHENDQFDNNNNTLNRKYFSFLTTNKLFNSNLNINEPKLRIHNDQLIDENDLKQQSHKQQHQQTFAEINDIKEMNTNVDHQDLENKAGGLSSSSSTSNSDSGCGCSIARSSILSNLDIINQNEINNEILTVPVSNYEYPSSSCSPSNSEKFQLDFESNIKSNNSTLSNHSTDESKEFKVTNNSLISNIGDERKKILTVIFDYNSSTTNSNGFQVKKGESVKILRNYDENLYLVATISNGSIGFIPKEYTVDLIELNHRLKQNLLIQEKLLSLPCSIVNSYLNTNQNLKKNLNLKLTKL